jgi:hypothetical protein
LTEFKSFDNLGKAFEGGIRQIVNEGSARPLGPENRYRARKGLEAEFDAALDRAGRRFVAKLQEKIDHRGPWWPALAETTLKERQDAGIGSDKPLDATHELREAIMYKVHPATHELEVGVKDGEHSVREGSKGEAVSYETLFIRNEFGFVNPSTSKYPGAVTPARPLWTGRDMEIIISAIAYQFGRDIIHNDRGGFAQWYKQK